MLSSFSPSTAPATAGEASRLMCSPSQARASGRSRGRRPGSGGGAARALLARSLAAGHERGVDLLEHDLAIDHALLDIGARRQVVHDVEEHLLEDGPQTTGPGASKQGLVGNRLESVVAELQLDVLQDRKSTRLNSSH